MTKLFSLLLIPLFIGCTNERKNLPRVASQNNQESETSKQDSCYLPNCEDSSGIEVEWTAGQTKDIIKREEFLKQIPKNYTGFLKLCKDKTFNDDAFLEGPQKRLFRLIKCKNGKVDGLSYSFEFEGGYYEEYYKNGIPEGTWVHYNSNKNFDIVCNYKNGVLDGESLSYYDNLKLSEKSFYKNGELEGEYFRYYKNGKLQTYEKRVTGISSTKIEYFEDGTIKRKFESTREKTTFEHYDRYGNLVDSHSVIPRTLKINRPQ
jgi:antitoxin component YwqK of YwqJK toxin-antitoxin module